MFQFTWIRSAEILISTNVVLLFLNLAFNATPVIFIMRHFIFLRHKKDFTNVFLTFGPNFAAESALISDQTSIGTITYPCTKHQ